MSSEARNQNESKERSWSYQGRPRQERHVVVSGRRQLREAGLEGSVHETELVLDCHRPRHAQLVARAHQLAHAKRRFVANAPVPNLRVTKQGNERYTPFSPAAYLAGSADCPADG